MKDRNSSTEKLVALTFDDGPNTSTTPKVLDKLEKHGVVASFFLIGEFVTDSTKPMVKREIELGCEICNHSWSHPYMDKLAPEQIKREVEDTDRLIRSLTGKAPAFFRPPFIVVSDEMYETIDLPFICGINCQDWDPNVTAAKRIDLILSNVKDGDIILLHDLKDNPNTVDALDAIITGLKEQGYTMVTISKLFELKGINPRVKRKLWSNVFE
jgi:peptidoglycan/xylan/chitin deacetylase (PgdA/CDA1 family)